MFGMTIIISDITPGLKSHFATECAQSIIFVVQKSSGCADPKVTYFATNLAII